MNPTSSPDEMDTDTHMLRRTNYLLSYIAFVVSIAALLQALDVSGVI